MFTVHCQRLNKSNLVLYLCAAASAGAPRRPDIRTRYETAAAAAESGGGGAGADGSDVVLIALEEASRAVDAALNATVHRLFTPSTASTGYGFIWPCRLLCSAAWHALQYFTLFILKRYVHAERIPPKQYGIVEWFN